MLRRQPRFNYTVCSFDVHFNHPTVSDYNWHSFSIGVERKNLQKLEFLCISSDTYFCGILGRFIELKTHSLCSINQSNLVRRRSLIEFLALFVSLSNNLMSNSQQSKILLSQIFATAKSQILSSLFISYRYITHWWTIGSFAQKIDKLLIIKTFLNLGRPFGIFDNQSQISIHLFSDHCNFELHQIHCKSASFVSKNVLNLSKFLIKRGGLDVGWLFAKIAVHEFILIDEVALRHFDNLYRNNQWDWYHCVDKHEVGAPDQ